MTVTEILCRVVWQGPRYARAARRRVRAARHAVHDPATESPAEPPAPAAASSRTTGANGWPLYSAGDQNLRHGERPSAEQLAGASTGARRTGQLPPVVSADAHRLVAEAAWQHPARVAAHPRGGASSVLVICVDISRPSTRPITADPASTGCRVTARARPAGSLTPPRPPEVNRYRH